jgi:hypothetical protein
MTSSWFFLSTLNYDARSTTHQILYFEIGHGLEPKELMLIFRCPPKEGKDQTVKTVLCVASKTEDIQKYQL